MHKTVLILGASGRFGRNAARAFDEAGWDVRTFNRQTDTLWDAAWGADVIVNAWNPPYNKWSSELPRLTADVIEVAQVSKALVVIPGNVYGYGTEIPEVITHQTPKSARNPLGQLRLEMEDAYKAAGVRTLVLRAGDYIDTEASGNWFDKVVTAEIKRGTIRTPGDAYVPHAWAYLPDVARALVGLCERDEPTPRFEEVLFPGYDSSLSELTEAMEEVFGRRFDLKPFAWWPVQLAQPFWPLAPHLLEMRYLWSAPHRISDGSLRAALPQFRATPLRDALFEIFEEHIYPDQPVARGRLKSGVCRPNYA